MAAVTGRAICFVVPVDNVATFFTCFGDIHKWEKSYMHDILVHTTQVGLDRIHVIGSLPGPDAMREFSERFQQFAAYDHVVLVGTGTTVVGASLSDVVVVTTACNENGETVYCIPDDQILSSSITLPMPVSKQHMYETALRYLFARDNTGRLELEPHEQQTIDDMNRKWFAANGIQPSLSGTQTVAISGEATKFRQCIKDARDRNDAIMCTIGTVLHGPCLVPKRLEQIKNILLTGNEFPQSLPPPTIRFGKCITCRSGVLTADTADMHAPMIVDTSAAPFLSGVRNSTAIAVLYDKRVSMDAACTVARHILKI